MYFKKLELVGFKSFFDKTTLHFEPGITAVVGPNGTGKSNIFDSIRWVLGEQSAKALRGSDMQDVIFNGTDSKEPLGMAEVSLTFDNDKRFFPVEQDEVVIGRRIFRSGESEYFLNKAQVRLKDILDLLMGTGIAQESYSLVEQGKIDLILSVRPEDRRLIFDEAAGITKYKAQKKETLRKLEETEQNLLRVNDIIAEVKRQIGSLERQANKARRYKEVFEELKSKEISLAKAGNGKLGKQKNEILNQINECQAQENQLLNIIREHEQKTDKEEKEQNALQDSIMDIKHQILNLENIISRNTELISFNRQRFQELDSSEAYLTTQIQQVKNRLIQDEEKLNNVKVEYEAIDENIKEKEVILKAKQDEFKDLGLKIKTSQEFIALAKKETLELVTKIAHTTNDITDLTAKQQISSARKRRLEVEKAKVKEEKSAVEESLKIITRELENLNKAVCDLNSKIANTKDELTAQESSLVSINSDIERLEKEKLTLESHKEFIEKLKTKYQDISEAMNAVVYLDKLPAKEITGLVIKIRDIRAQDLKLSGEAKPIDLDTQKLSQKLAGINQDLETKKFTKITKEEQIKELNQVIQGLQQDLRRQDIALANKKTNYETVLDHFNKIKEEDEVIILELADVDKEISTQDELLMQLKVSLERINQEHKGQEDLILNEQNNITSSSNLKENLLVIITQTKTELEGLNKRQDSDQATLRILEGTYNQDKEALVNLQKQIEEAKKRQESLNLEIKDLESKMDEAKENIKEKNSLLQELQDKYSRISKGMSQATLKMELDRKELDTLKNKLHQLQMADKDIDFKISSIKDRILQVYNIDLDAARSSSEAEIDGSTALTIDPEQSRRVDVNILEDDIQRLKEKIDAYGTVNLVAIEEYDELKKRYDFLTQQQNDLISSRESLDKAILKINQTTKKMFQETFQKVCVEFRNYFRLLFNGGDAQIFLIDEKDPLESGIEIICRPPGKKLQNVLLLSGGEKALSAIALIFAIFKVKPSPFCVLDEIDAALDEANVDRYSRLLQEFAKVSQFIVITHNKRTIVNADVMYGITMGESGISKIVSVKFAQGQRPENNKEPLVVEA